MRQIKGTLRLISCYLLDECGSPVCWQHSQIYQWQWERQVWNDTLLEVAMRRHKMGAQSLMAKKQRGITLQQRGHIQSSLKTQRGCNIVGERLRLELIHVLP